MVTAFIPRCGYDIVQTANPEVMVLTSLQERYIAEIEFDFTPQAIGIGSGMGQEMTTQNAFHKFLKTNKSPLIVDADALNILSKNPQWLSLLPDKRFLRRILKNWNALLENGVRRKKNLKKQLLFPYNIKLLWL